MAYNIPWEKNTDNMFYVYQVANVETNADGGDHRVCSGGFGNGGFGNGGAAFLLFLLCERETGRGTWMPRGSHHVVNGKSMAYCARQLTTSNILMEWLNLAIFQNFRIRLNTKNYGEYRTLKKNSWTLYIIISWSKQRVFQIMLDKIKYWKHALSKYFFATWITLFYSFQDVTFAYLKSSSFTLYYCYNNIYFLLKP